MHQLIHYNMGSKSAIGIGNGICFKQVRDKGGGSYIDPLVRDSIVGLWKFDQNTNESPTRNIIKNTIKDKGGDLELLNFGYKLNSGYGKYEVDFTSWSRLIGVKAFSNKFVIENKAFNCAYYVRNKGEDLDEFKAKINNHTDGIIRYGYINQNGVITYLDITPDNSNRVITFPKSYNSIKGLPNHICGFQTPMFVNTGITIEQLPLYEGALVTDGKDDMIVSQKTVQEMLGGSNVCTVVSMIHQINLSADVNISINNIRSESVAHVCARHLNTAYGKTGIFGYSKQLNTTSNPTLINNILGDKKDYIADGNSVIDTTDKYFVQGYKYNDSLYELSEVAVYWTFISNKVLTTDEINQIIAYFKLDKYVTPQVIYAVKRQGLTNDTPDADWYLKDFSGNGHDMTLYNFAKKLGSGIGKYEVDFNTWTPQSYVADSTYTSNKLHVTNIKVGNAILYTNKGANAMKVKITGIQSFNLVYRYIAENDVWEALKVDRDGIYELPASITTTKTYYTGFAVPYYIGDCDITIEQIPDYEGALVSDGKDDYGYADNLPIFKDYTVAIDRAWINLVGARTECLSTKNSDPDWGAFTFELSESIGRSTFSFGNANQVSIDVDRKISYQSKYSYNGAAIAAGNIVDGKDLFLFRSRSAFPYYAEAAIWSYLLFPYSLSEFLLERQLKKYKLGTLYPDMVEFRPVVSGNIPYNAIEISQGPTTLYNKSINKTGIYLQEGSTVRVYIQPSGIDEVSKITINGVEYTDLPINPNGYYYADFPITKSPQKISYAIDEYIRFEDIVQPYPYIVKLRSLDGHIYTYGDKLKVGETVQGIGWTNLLDGLYEARKIWYNGINWGVLISLVVAKQMVFTSDKRWLLDTSEPHAIYSPQKLNIPNSSLKILGYVPDLTGKGNHGKLNNFAYTEDSGVAADGSIKFDGTDDHITISNIIGGKCIMAKVTVNRNSGIIYDQRRANVPNKSWMQLNPSSVIFEQNAVSTYIDGILNHNVTGSDLVSKTVNLTCELEIGDTSGTYQPTIGSSYAVGYTTDINLYEFMLFPDVPDEEEIKELNDIIGIEGGYVESPNYYWDAYGKKNTDTDRNLIADQVSKDVANALEVKNVAYNSESGYTDDNGLLLDGVEDHAVNTVIPAVTDFTVIGKRNLLNHESAFAIKGGNTTSTAAFVLEYSSDKFYNFGGVNTVEYPNTITVATKSSYNNNPAVSSQGVDSLGLRIGEYRNYYSKLVFYKLMLYIKTIDQLSINMLKNMFERDELIDVTNPIFKKKEL